MVGGERRKNCWNCGSNGELVSRNTTELGGVGAGVGGLGLRHHLKRTTLNLQKGMKNPFPLDPLLKMGGTWFYRDCSLHILSFSDEHKYLNKMAHK